MRRTLLNILSSLAVVMLTALPAMAQELKPPTPGKVDDSPAIMNILFLIVILAIVVGAFVIPAKRGHQD